MTKAIIPSPIGAIRIVATSDQLQRIAIPEAIDNDDHFAEPPRKGSLLAEAVAQIRAYFDGKLRTFDLPLAPALSDRGEALRAAIVGIGYGEALSYGALAQICRSSPRAIGQACSRNPFPLVVPCHRVLASGGRLGHYSAGNGLATKAWLLDHETGGRLL